MNRTLMLALVAATVLGLGCGAGAAYLTQPAAPSALAAAAGAGQSGAAGQPAGQGGAFGQARAADGTQTSGRGPTSGTVEQVDAGKLTVRTDAGTVDVPLSDTTVVQKLDKAAASDLKVGDLVVGRGSPNAQGALQLSSLQIMPPGAERGGFGFGGAAAKPGGFGTSGAAAKPGGANAAAAKPDGENGGTAARPAGGGGNGGRGGQAGGAAGAGNAEGRGGGGGAGNGGGAGGDGRGGGVAGTIAKIDGATLVVTTQSGDVTATLAADAEVRRLSTAGRDDIKAGQSVTVVGVPGGGRTVVTITAV